MGMDGIEIVMLAEERFGIRIGDDEAANIRTPGMLIDLVATKLKAASMESCISQRSFYRLRRALMRVIGVARDCIRLNMPIRGFVVQNNEREFWDKLNREIGARSWPAFGLAPAVELARNCFVFMVWIGASIAGWLLCTKFGANSRWIIGIVIGLAVTLGVSFLLRHLQKPFENFIPSRIETVSDLVPFVATSNEIAWSREDMAQAVRKIVEEVLCPAKGKYREEADFVKELGLT